MDGSRPSVDAAEPAPICGRGRRSTRSSLAGAMVSFRADVQLRTFASSPGDDGVAVGLATGHIWRALHVDQPTAWLTALVVSSSARRRGVGRMLVGAVESWALAEGCARVALLSGLSRHDAHSFYERLGFAHSGRRYSKNLPRT